MSIEVANRLSKLPPYLFVEIDKAKRAAIAEGRDVINLGIGDPDQATHQPIIEALAKAAADPANHHYPLDAGVPALRVEIVKWFQSRFGVELDPNTEMYPLIGSKEGIAHLPLGIINPGDKVLITDPAYPAYQAAVAFAGGEPVSIQMQDELGFLPTMEDIVAHKDAKAIFVCYPNNPTAAVANKEFYQELVNTCKEHNIIIISDLAYSEVYYDGNPPVSILEVDGAKDIAIEFHSFSKTYYMTGWRLGWACGNVDLVAALAKVKSNYDSGIFNAVQHAGIAALNLDESYTDNMRKTYQARRDALVGGLNDLGWDVPSPKAAFYVFAKLPNGFTDSMACAKTFLDQANIVATPGVGFGQYGEGYIRMALTMGEERIKEAVDRLGKIL